MHLYIHGRTVPYATAVFVCSRSNLCSGRSLLFASSCPTLAREGVVCRQCRLAAGLAPCSFGGRSGTLQLTCTLGSCHPLPIGEHSPAQRPVSQERKTASVSPASWVSDLEGGTPGSNHEHCVRLPRGSCTSNRFSARHRSSPSLLNTLG